MKSLRMFIGVLFLIGIASSSVYAQDFGIRAGWQSAATHNDGDKVQGNQNSLYAGIYRSRPIGPGDFLHWSGGVEYSQQGHREDSDNFRKIHYISLPLALQFKFGPAILQGGINTNMRVAEKVYLMNEDITDDTKTQFLDFAYQFGAAFHFGPVGVEARYHGGLLDVNEGNKNRYLQIGVSLRIKSEDK